MENMTDNKRAARELVKEMRRRKIRGIEKNLTAANYFQEIDYLNQLKIQLSKYEND